MPKSIEHSNEIAALKRAILDGGDPVGALANALPGRTALVVSCGPSIALWKDIHRSLRDEGVEPIVVCVKQAILQVDGLCDLHFLNPSNLQRYQEYPNDVISFFLGIDGFPKLQNYDVCFLARPEKDLEKSLAHTRDFGAHTLARTGELRPWGPGIIQEAVIYTLHHMGIKRIITAGWDIADRNGDNVHFFDHGSPTLPARIRMTPRIILERCVQALGLSRPARHLYMAFRHYRARVAFTRGRICYRTRMQAGEADMVAASIPDMVRWLASEGVSLEIISNSRWMARQGQDPAGQA
jgi:hypothetical protein